MKWSFRNMEADTRKKFKGGNGHLPKTEIKNKGMDGKRYQFF